MYCSVRHKPLVAKEEAQGNLIVRSFWHKDGTAICDYANVQRYNTN